MPSLQNKKILLGVTGGIAAYKSAELIRLLQKAGADVKVTMTEASQAFITPLTLQALSGNPVHTDLLDPQAEAAMGHIELARWADLILVAPATADFMARLDSGHANDLLSTLCLATKAPIALAPAMNQAMWNNTATQQNTQSLIDRKVLIWGPTEGLQACGDVGLGRMLEPSDIVSHTIGHFKTGAMAGKTIVITAGPTQEPIDPVRYISNHSSGKMGYALASAAVSAGAKTILISGPTSLQAPDQVKVFRVQTAKEMLEVSLKLAADADVFIAAAAVSDYRPAVILEQKLKKTHTDTMGLELTKNPDIVASVAKLAKKPYTVGFAAETNNLIEYAKLKLQTKKLDLIIANDVSDRTIGFNSDDNAITIVDHSEPGTPYKTIARCNKNKLARDLIQNIAERINLL